MADRSSLWRTSLSTCRPTVQYNQMCGPGLSRGSPKQLMLMCTSVYVHSLHPYMCENAAAINRTYSHFSSHWGHVRPLEARHRHSPTHLPTAPAMLGPLPTSGLIKTSWRFHKTAAVQQSNIKFFLYYFFNLFSHYKTLQGCGSLPEKKAR